MLTNEQYIEIATEVWGWKVKVVEFATDPVVSVKGKTEDRSGDTFDTAIMMSELKSQVNSWQGFGRTVEAMAEKGQYLLPHHIVESLTKDPKSLIETTHLAALEVLK